MYEFMATNKLDPMVIFDIKCLLKCRLYNEYTNKSQISYFLIPIYKIKGLRFYFDIKIKYINTYKVYDVFQCVCMNFISFYPGV